MSEFPFSISPGQVQESGGGSHWGEERLSCLRKTWFSVTNEVREGRSRGPRGLFASCTRLAQGFSKVCTSVKEGLTKCFINKMHAF